MPLAVMSTLNTSAAQRVAMQASDCDLIDAVRSLNLELLAAFEAGERGTQAHVGKVEMVTAFASELHDRGFNTDFLSDRFGRMRDGSDLPVLVQWEDGPGGRIKLQTPILVF